jgi:hypothetical protein
MAARRIRALLAPPSSAISVASKSGNSAAVATKMKRTTKMLTVINSLRDAARARARFVQTRDEIARLPLDVALDLGIYRGDAAQIAHDAVYGKAA